MYPRNAASPPRIAIGAVVQISDGAVQTSGCTVRVLEEGGTEGDGGGTTAYSTDGVVLYTPTQGETDQSTFILIAKKTGCIPASVTVCTTNNATAGNVNVGSVGGTAQTARDLGASVLLSAGTGTGQISLSSGAVTVGTNNDKTGYSLSQAFPTNFASQVISSSGAVTVGTNNDKTGYSLSQTFPTNFANQIITTSGAVTVGTNNDKTGYALTQAFPANFASQLISASGAVTVGTNNDKTGYALTQAFPANFASLSITAAGLTAIQSNQKKAVGLSNLEFLMTSTATHAPQTLITSTAFTVQRSIDGGLFSTGAIGAVAEVGAGIYKVSLTSDDMNGNVITVRASASTAGADDTFLTLITVP